MTKRIPTVGAKLDWWFTLGLVTVLACLAENFDEAQRIFMQNQHALRIEPQQRTREGQGVFLTQFAPEDIAEWLSGPPLWARTEGRTRVPGGWIWHGSHGDIFVKVPNVDNVRIVEARPDLVSGDIILPGINDHKAGKGGPQA